jgi:hypothetical protein
VAAFAQFLSPDRPVNLPLVVLPGLAERREEHDRPTWSTPARYPGRNIAKPDPQLPYRPLKVI